MWPFLCHGFITYQGNREDLRALLPGRGHLRVGEMRPPGVLPLLHQDAGVVRAEVLRRLPGGARQGSAAPLTLYTGDLIVSELGLSAFLGGGAVLGFVKSARIL